MSTMAPVKLFPGGEQTEIVLTNAKLHVGAGLLSVVKFRSCLFAYFELTV